MANNKADFWKFVRKDALGCWEWQHATNGRYGVFMAGRENYRTHRLAWELTNGSIPTGMSVCHKCDNPKCCRPDHLFLGTHGDNMRDAAVKGRLRGLKGEQHPGVKLTGLKVDSIRKLLAKGETRVAIALQFGVSPSTISAIYSRRIWGHR